MLQVLVILVVTDEHHSTVSQVLVILVVTYGHHTTVSQQSLTRFNKIAIQGKGPDGKYTRKSLAYQEPIVCYLCVTHPPDICVNLVFKDIDAASIYIICR